MQSWLAPSSRPQAKRIEVPGGPYRHCAARQYSAVRRVWGLAVFLISAATRAGMRRILSPESYQRLYMCAVLALQYEAQHCHLEDHLLKQVISQAQFRSRIREDKNAEGALAKASLALAK